MSKEPFEEMPDCCGQEMIVCGISELYFFCISCCLFRLIFIKVAF